jgi:hypothetical protein
LTDAIDLRTGVGYPNIGESFNVYGRIALLPDSTEVYGSFLNGEATHVFAQAIDRAKPLNFSFLAHDYDERYQMNSLSIEVSGTAVPAPSSLTTLVGVGVMVLGMERWKKRKRRIRIVANARLAVG